MRKHECKIFARCLHVQQGKSCGTTFCSICGGCHLTCGTCVCVARTLFLLCLLSMLVADMINAICSTRKDKRCEHIHMCVYHYTYICISIYIYIYTKQTKSIHVCFKFLLSEQLTEVRKVEVGALYMIYIYMYVCRMQGCDSCAVGL